MAKIPIILEPGRADGKLVASSAIFDENKGMFQSELNDIQDTLNSDNPNKPLSAKQGKMLKELLDAKVIEAGAVPIDTEPTEGHLNHVVSSDGIKKELNRIDEAHNNLENVIIFDKAKDIPIELQQDSIYISNTGKIASSYSEYGISKDIRLNCGDFIYFYSYAAPSVSMISIKKDDTQFIPKFIPITEGYSLAFYIAEENCTIILSGKIGTNSENYLKTLKKGTLSFIPASELNNILSYIHNNNISINNNTKNIEINTNDIISIYSSIFNEKPREQEIILDRTSVYINKDGNVISSIERNGISELISVKTGDLVCFTANTSPEIAMISEYENETYKPLYCSDKKGYDTAILTIDHDCQIVLSGHINTENKKLLLIGRVSFITTNTFLPIIKNVNDIIQQQSVDITNNKNNIKAISNIIGYKYPIPMIEGYAYSISNIGDTIQDPIKKDNYNCALVPCFPRAKVTISGTGDSIYKLWAFLDDTKKIIDCAGSGITEVEQTHIAPNNTAYVIINSNTKNLSYIVEDDNLQQQIKTIYSFLQIQSNTVLPDIKYKGCYINNKGSVIQSEEYNVYGPINVNQGDIIEVLAFAPTEVSIFSETENYINRIIGKGWSYSIYNYIGDKTTDLYISSKNDKFTFKHIKTNIINDIIDKTTICDIKHIDSSLITKAYSLDLDLENNIIKAGVTYRCCAYLLSDGNDITFSCKIRNNKPVYVGITTEIPKIGVTVENIQSSILENAELKISVPKDKYCVVFLNESYHTNDNFYIISNNNIKDEITRLKNITKHLSNVEKIVNLNECEFKNGSYIYKNGNITESTDYSIYGPIFIPKNSLVNLKIYGTPEVAIISKYNNGQYIPVLIPSARGVFDHTIITEENANFYISGKHTEVHDLFISYLTLQEDLANTEIKLSNEIKEITKNINDNSKYENTFLRIAYSSIGVATINTIEHFITAAHLGFNAVKADMRLTSDNHIVLCHDVGFTLDDNRYIIDYDESNMINIHDMTYDEVMALEHKSSDIYNHHPKICDLETLLSFCKEYNIIPFLTLRTEFLNDTIDALLPILEKFSFMKKAIINSFPGYSQIVALRKKTKDLMAVYTTNSNWILDKDTVDIVNNLGNTNICLFNGSNWNLVDASQEAIDYAKSLGISVGNCLIGTYEDYQKALDRGLTISHIFRPIFDPTPLNHSLNILIDNNTVSSLNIPYSRYSFDYEFTNNSLRLFNIKLAGSNRYFNDGLLEFWFNFPIPYTMSVRNSTGTLHNIKWINNGIEIDNINPTVYQKLFINILV